MATFTKLVLGAGTEMTPAPATLIDVVNPSVPLADTVSNLARIGVYSLGFYLLLKD